MKCEDALDLHFCRDFKIYKKREFDMIKGWRWNGAFSMEFDMD